MLDGRNIKSIQKVVILSVALLATVTFVISGYKFAVADEYKSKITAVDELIRERVEEERVPGLSIVIVQGDDVIYQEGFGVTSLDDPLRMPTPKAMAAPIATTNASIRYICPKFASMPFSF